MEDHDSTSQAHSGECCDICGDIGVSCAIVTCPHCKVSCEHLYCMRICQMGCPKDWYCDDCKRRNEKVSPTSEFEGRHFLWGVLKKRAKYASLFDAAHDLDSNDIDMEIDMIGGECVGRLDIVVSKESLQLPPPNVTSSPVLSPQPEVPLNQDPVSEGTSKKRWVKKDALAKTDTDFSNRPLLSLPPGEAARQAVVRGISREERAKIFSLSFEELYELGYKSLAEALPVMEWALERVRFLAHKISRHNTEIESQEQDEPKAAWEKEKKELLEAVSLSSQLLEAKQGKVRDLEARLAVSHEAAVAEYRSSPAFAEEKTKAINDYRTSAGFNDMLRELMGPVTDYGYKQGLKSVKTLYKGIDLALFEELQSKPLASFNQLLDKYGLTIKRSADSDDEADNAERSSKGAEE